jgi:hypothetical protein
MLFLYRMGFGDFYEAAFQDHCPEFGHPNNYCLKTELLPDESVANESGRIAPSDDSDPAAEGGRDSRRIIETHNTRKSFPAE